MASDLDMERVQQIGAAPSAVLRNLQITQFYHEASIELRALIGPRDVTWFAFGAWASNTAGEFIRGEEIPGWGRDVLDHDFPTRLDDIIRDFLHGTSRSVANGNLVVFKELAPIAVTLISSLKAGDSVEAFIDSFQEQLSPDGEPRLARAIGAWYEAVTTQDADGRAQAILFANWNAVYHEQQRLQPLLEDAMALPVVSELAKRLEGASDESWLERITDRALGPLLSHMRTDWREFNTRLLMHYELPGSVLRLGHDVAPLVPGTPFPAATANLTRPATAIFWNWVVGLPGLSGSAAEDWLSLPDRMQFIVTLFRAHQQNERLFDPPFTPGQLAHITAGRIPVEFDRR